MNAPDTAIVLCAGLGARLRPLTDHVPKPLLRFLDRPIASYSLDLLARVGVKTLGANAHHLPEQVERFFAAEVARLQTEGHGRVRAEVVVENELLGTGGGALGVWNHLGRPRAPLWVVNGDCVYDADLEQMIKVHRRTGAVATLLCRPAVPGEGVVRLDATRAFVAQLPGGDEPARSPRFEAEHAVTFAGVYLVDPAVFDVLPSRQSCLIRSGLAELLRRGDSIAVCEHEGFWADLGTPSRYMNATRAVLENPSLLPSSGLKNRDDFVHVASTRTVHPDAVIEGPAYIADGAVVERGARVGPWAVVGSRSVVRSGGHVQESVLLGDSEVSGWVFQTIMQGATQVRSSGTSA